MQRIPIFNFPSTLSLSWFVDNQLIAENIENIDLETSIYDLGRHEVKVMVEDFTDLVRNDPEDLLKFELVWDLIIECNSNPDLNMDADINVQDVIILVNHILEISDDIICIDLNQDGPLNILDVILVINIILSTLN